VIGFGAVHRYHDGTKHHFNRFARSLGYLDWASQPSPFRSFHGAPVFALPPRPDAPNDALLIGTILRHAFGLSAWKAVRDTRWSLRVNPSSGNLHPTEAYIVAGPNRGLASTPAVYHYASDQHVLEERCAFDVDLGGETILIALTSIHWREAWKYGERAFRYCQHDLGHAIAAVTMAARLVGWHARLLPDWSHREIAALVGLDRDEDWVEAEREEPGCLLELVRAGSSVAAGRPPVDSRAIVEAVRRGRWTGLASRLSEDHVQWTFIDEIARATEDPGRPSPTTPPPRTLPNRGYPPSLILQRRSALAFDGLSSIGAKGFFAMLSRVMPSSEPPWTTLWWEPRLHLAIFVHRVDGLDPGLYLLPRTPRGANRLRDAMHRDFDWETATPDLPLVRLARGDSRRLAERLSCDQPIAADGFFSLGMIADFDAGLRAYGAAFYRHLFWESGVIGQMLYLEAEAASARSTGIGCFYDDPVHETLGLTGHDFQSLYHFTVGIPVEDPRLTTEPGYPWG
jgi:SagB-type dehydrogenase family enzyme